MMLFARNQCTSTSRISRSSRIRLFPIQRRSFSKFRSFPTAPVTIEMCVSNCNGKQRETNVRTLCKGDFIRETIFRRSLQIINCGRFELGPTEKMTSKTVVHDDYCTTPSLSLCGYLSICVCLCLGLLLSYDTMRVWHDVDVPKIKRTAILYKP